MKKSKNDQLLIVAAGVTLAESVTAANELAKKGIAVRVLDPFTIKPIDQEAIIQNAREAGGKILTVEDHYPEGGIGEAVLSAVALEKDIIVKVIAVRELPMSGPPKALLNHFGLSAPSIVEHVTKFLNTD